MSQQWRGAPRGHVPYGGYRRPRLTDEYLPVLAAGEVEWVNPCWCTGLVHEHDQGCPVTAVAASEFDKRKEERWATRRDAEERLDHRHLKKFKREVREAILLLVNTHGVEYRLQNDGQHIFLYSGARGERPFKIAAMRPVNKQMQFLVPWVREHFPHIDLATGKAKDQTAFGLHLFEPNDGEPPKCKVCGFEVDDGRAEHIVEEVNGYPAEDVTGEPFRCTACGRPELDCSKDPCAAVIADREATMPEPEEEIEVTEAVVEDHPVPKPPPGKAASPLKAVPDPFVKSQQEAADRAAVEKALVKDGWERYVYPTAGPSQFFWVKGDLLRCTAEGCTYQREGSFAGVHLHEYTHTDKGEEMLQRGVESRRQNAALKVERAFESITFLAQQYGFVVMTKEEAARFKESAKTTEALAQAQAEIARLQTIVDEQEAKIALAREAFGL